MVINDFSLNIYVDLVTVIIIPSMGLKYVLILCNIKIILIQQLVRIFLYIVIASRIYKSHYEADLFLEHWIESRFRYYYYTFKFTTLLISRSRKAKSNYLKNLFEILRLKVMKYLNRCNFSILWPLKSTSGPTYWLIARNSNQ